MERETLFTQLGSAAIKIVKSLCASQELGRYLKYMVEDPLDSKLKDVSKEELYDKNIRARPLLRLDELTQGFVLISWNQGDVDENLDFVNYVLCIDVFTDINHWAINDICQRPFKIMDIIYRLLNNRMVTGIGKLKFNSFELKILTDEYSQHKMWFTVTGNSSNETLK